MPSKKSCWNCGHFPEKSVKDQNKEKHCKLCDENYVCSTKQHASSPVHKARKDLLDTIKEMNLKLEQIEQAKSALLSIKPKL